MKLTALSVWAFWRPLGRPCCCLVWVNIRCFGCFCWRFRPDGESLLQTPKRNQNAGPRRTAPRLGSEFLRSGIHPGASPTVCFAAPPLDVFDFVERSLRSHPRMNPSTQPADGAGTARSKAVLELTLIVWSGEKRVRTAFAFVLLWEWACPRRRPTSRPGSGGCTYSLLQLWSVLSTSGRGLG